MSLKALARAAFDTILAQQTSSVVSVVNGSKTASGLVHNKPQDAELEDNGETGATSGTVHCDLTEVGALVAGQTITVDGVSAFVMRAVPDPAGALVRIEYQLQKPK